MKLYMFYKIPPEEALNNSEDLKVQDKYPLYAFTNNKKLYNKFKKERNMSNFYLIKKSNINKEEFTEFANVYRGQLLDEYSYSHYMFGYRKNVMIVSTWQERELVDSYNEVISEGSTNSKNIYEFNIFTFNKKVLNLLGRLEYISIWDQFHESADKFKNITSDEYSEYLSGGWPDISFDEFNVFIYLFSDLYFERE